MGNNDTSSKNSLWEKITVQLTGSCTGTVGMECRFCGGPDVVSDFSLCMVASTVRHFSAVANFLPITSKRGLAKSEVWKFA
jgi:hypothetical protein